MLEFDDHVDSHRVKIKSFRQGNHESGLRIHKTFSLPKGKKNNLKSTFSRLSIVNEDEKKKKKKKKTVKGKGVG